MFSFLDQFLNPNKLEVTKLSKIVDGITALEKEVATMADDEFHAFRQGVADERGQCR